MDRKQVIETSPTELFALIGEREFVKFKQAEEIAKLYAQIDEMSKTIEELRKELKEFTTLRPVDVKRG